MKNSVKKLIVSLIAVVMFACVGLAVLSNQDPVNAVTVTFTGTSINDTYDIGEKVAFPLSVEVSYKGETKTAEDGILVFPSGKIINVTEDAVELAEQGEYSLRYFFMDGLIKVTAEKTFAASNELYYLTSTVGSITPVTAQMNKASDFNFVTDNTMATEREGLIVRLGDGCAFKYNKPVDLTDANDLGLADIISIDPRVYNITGKNENGTFAYEGTIADYVKIKLTDCYDAGTFVEILVQCSNAPYVRAGTNHQTAGGCKYPDESKTSGTIKEYYVGSIRGICRLGSYGQWQHGYGVGTAGTNDKPVGALTFKYDYANHRLYAYGGGKPEEEAVIVNDFRSPSIYGTNLFEGFTTGEVFVSVECGTYNLSQQARVDILSIGKDQGDYLLNAYNLDASKPDYDRYNDEIAPVIKLNGVSTDKVYCAVGDTFVIPSATPYDVNLIGGIETRVYRNYNSQKKASVNIVNGAFKVDAVDTYYVEYSAVDKYGNRGVALFRVYGIDNGKGKSLTVDTEKLITLEAGVPTMLPAFEVSSVNDGATVSLDIIAKSDRETLLIGSYKGLDAINEVGANGVQILPSYAGEYTISYILKDNVYDTTNDPFEYVVTCVPSDMVSFLNAPFLERYLIKGATYGLREFTAFEFSTGEPNPKKVDAYISFDGGEFEKVEDTDKVEITGSETVQIKYAIDDDNYVVSNVVKIADVNFGDYSIMMRKYFQYEEGAFTVQELDKDGWEMTDIVYESTKTSGSNRLEFVNSLFINKLVFEYKIDQALSNYESFNLILTDVTDPTAKAVINVGKNATTSYISVNGGIKYAYDRAFGSGQFSTISYDLATKKLSLGKTIIEVDFKMPSNRCYLDVELNGIHGKAGMMIRTINNQKLLGDSHEDTNVPEIFVERTTGNFEIGDVVTINAPDYADVLSPIVLSSMTFSVKQGDNFVTSVDGVKLDGTNSAFENVQVKLDSLGEYSVIYSAQDVLGNYVSARYYFNVVDIVPPVITVSDLQEGYVYNVKLGQKITITYQVSDNVTPDEECRVAVMVTNMTSYETSYWNRSDQEEGFTLGEATFFIIEEGMHRVTVYCRDAAGNYVTKTYIFMVKA